VVAGRRGHPLDLDQAVQHDRADPDRDRAIDFGQRLVVTVHPEASRFDSGGQRDREFAAARHVDIETGLDHPACDFGRQERLPRVVDLGSGAHPGKFPIEGLANPGGSASDVRLIDNVDRGSVFGDERRDVDTPDREHAGSGARRDARPHARLEVVRIRRQGEPCRSERIGGHGG
jgi:hypothetical protein